MEWGPIKLPPALTLPSSHSGLLAAPNSTCAFLLCLYSNDLLIPAFKAQPKCHLLQEAFSDLSSLQTPSSCHCCVEMVLAEHTCLPCQRVSPVP